MYRIKYTQLNCLNCLHLDGKLKLLSKLTHQWTFQLLSPLMNQLTVFFKLIVHLLSLIWTTTDTLTHFIAHP